MTTSYYYSGDPVLPHSGVYTWITKGTFPIYTTSDGDESYTTFSSIQTFKNDDFIEDIYQRYIYVLSYGHYSSPAIPGYLIEIDTLQLTANKIYTFSENNHLSCFCFNEDTIWIAKKDTVFPYTKRILKYYNGSFTEFSLSPNYWALDYTYADLQVLTNNRDGLFSVGTGSSETLYSLTEQPGNILQYTALANNLQLGMSLGWLNFIQAAIDHDIWGFRGNFNQCTQIRKNINNTYTVVIHSLTGADHIFAANGMSDDFYMGGDLGPLYRWNGTTFDQNTVEPWLIYTSQFVIQQIIYLNDTEIYLIGYGGTGDPYGFLVYKGYLDNWTLVDSIYSIDESLLHDHGLTLRSSFPSNPLIPVPNILNKTLTSGTSLLSALTLGTGTVTYSFNDIVPTNLIAVQDPVADTLVYPHTTVDVNISMGQVVVPSVSGMELTAATNLLIASGCTPDDITYRYYEKLVSGYIFEAIVPSGHVIYQDPGVGTILTGVYNVDLNISLGILGELEHMPDRYVWGTTYSPLKNK